MAVEAVMGATVNLAVEPAQLAQMLTAEGYPAQARPADDAWAPGAAAAAERASLARQAVLAGVLTLPVFVAEMGGHLIPALLRGAPT